MSCGGIMFFARTKISREGANLALVRLRGDAAMGLMTRRRGRNRPQCGAARGIRRAMRDIENAVASIRLFDIAA